VATAQGLSGLPVLVTGATGTQGSAVARALLRSGAVVTAVVRDTRSAAAEALLGVGADVVAGDLDDLDSLREAVRSKHGVFSMQPAPGGDFDSERRRGRNLVHTSRESGVRHFVHSSVSGTGWRRLRPDVDPGVMENYWASKEAVEEFVRSAEFETWTILKPAFMMENFIGPKAGHMFPDLGQGEIVTACAADVELPMIAADDLGQVVTSALADPTRFAGAEIELAAERLSFVEIARAIGKATGRDITVIGSATEEATIRYGPGAWTPMQLWFQAVGYPARPAHAERYGLRLPTSFADFLERHRSRIPT